MSRSICSRLMMNPADYERATKWDINGYLVISLGEHGYAYLNEEYPEYIGYADTLDEIEQRTKED